MALGCSNTQEFSWNLRYDSTVPRQDVSTLEVTLRDGSCTEGSILERATWTAGGAPLAFSGMTPLSGDATLEVHAFNSECVLLASGCARLTPPSTTILMSPGEVTMCGDAVCPDPRCGDVDAGRGDGGGFDGGGGDAGIEDAGVIPTEDGGDDPIPVDGGCGSETCNAMDDDCDGRVDEEAGDLHYVDQDGDGHGAESSAVRACTAPSGTIRIGGDCDDTSPFAHPGCADPCDGVDNDCDDRVDEDVSDCESVLRGSFLTPQRVGDSGRPIVSGLTLFADTAEAASACSELGLWLPEPRSEDENRALLDYIVTAFPSETYGAWLGGGDPAVAGVYRWASDGMIFHREDGPSAGYADWAVGQPSDSTNNEQCLAARDFHPPAARTQTWADWICTGSMRSHRAHCTHPGDSCL